MTETLIDFTNTRAAIAVYDATAAMRKRNWDEIKTNEDVDKAEAADVRAVNMVRDTFYDDAKGTQSRDRVDMLSILSIRHLAGLPLPPRSFRSIGGVGFGQLTGETWPDGSAKWKHTSFMGDERVKLLRTAMLGQPLPEGLILVGQIDGGYIPITAEAVDWSVTRLTK